MPEIAEVALMAKAIRDVSVGHQITNIEVLGGRYSKQPLNNLDELKASLPLVVNAVKTKGKRCWLELSKLEQNTPVQLNWWILISFGMSGAIHYEPNEAEIMQARVRTKKPNLTRADYMKFYHIRVSIDNNVGFYFGDMRQFGSWKLFKTFSELEEVLGNLGPDMLTGPIITDAEFIEIFRDQRFRNKNICKVLMSQQAISGIGVYIKSEVLYQCRIHPDALISDLSDQNLIEMHQTIRKVVQSAFVGNGASLYTFSGARQEKGTFQKLLLVYNQKCDPLGNLVKRSKTCDQRTTHWVPAIQVIGKPSDTTSNSPSNTPKLLVPKPKLKLPIQPDVNPIPLPKIKLLNKPTIKHV